MSDLRVAADFFQGHFPKTILSVIDMSTLQLRGEGFIEPDFKELVTDMLYSVELKKGQAGYLYVLAEHQSTPDKLMAFRLLRYTCAIIAHHLGEKKQEEGEGVLPLVVPLVFYHGRQTPYPYTLDVFDLF